MNVARWGPSAWTFIHTVAFNYPEVPGDYDRERYRRFFHGLQEMLPCKYCRESFKVFLEEIPIEPYLGDREGVIFWSYRIHDRVNKKLEKESPPLVDVIRTYEGFRAKCAKRETRPGKLVGTCMEPMKNFETEDEFSTYARRIEEKYGTVDNPRFPQHRLVYPVWCSFACAAFLAAALALVVLALRKNRGSR